MKENYNATPGPWKQSPGFMIEGANGDYVCRVDASEGRSHFANAQLIASAPELLGALEKIDSILQGDMRDALHDESREAYQFIEQLRVLRGLNMTVSIIARQAIAKAKGGV